jgi:hypothetical protein
VVDVALHPSVEQEVNVEENIVEVQGDAVAGRSPGEAHIQLEASQNKINRLCMPLNGDFGRS